MQNQFVEVAEKLKGAIQQKGQKWMSDLVKSKTGSSIKNQIVKSLVRENHQMISNNLLQIRAGIQFNYDKNPDRENIRLDDVDNSVNIDDLVDILPDDFVNFLDNFVKKEIFVDSEESEDEIMEVPVPPKPPVECVTLEDNPSPEPEPFVPDPLDELRRLAKEEEDLYEELRQIEEQRESVMSRIIHLKEERSKILNREFSN